MDHPVPSALKRPRISEIVKLQSKSWISQQFPQQSFGTVSIKRPNQLPNDSAEANKMKKELNLQPVLPFTKLPSIKFLPNKEAIISNKMQKLKLKSQDGRDLGEINVKLLPQSGDSIGGKTIMLTKQNVFRQMDRSVSLSLSKPAEKGKVESKIAHLPVQVPVVEGTSGNVGSISGRVVSPSLSPRSTQSRGSSSECANDRMEQERTRNPEEKTAVQIAAGDELSSRNRTDKIVRKRLLTSAEKHKIFVVRTEKQGGLGNLRSIERGIRKYAQVPFGQKIVILRSENKKSAIGNTVTALQSPISKKKAITVTNSTSNVQNISLTSEQISEFLSKVTKQKFNEGQIELLDLGKISDPAEPLIAVKKRRMADPIDKVTDSTTVKSKNDEQVKQRKKSFPGKNVKSYSGKNEKKGTATGRNSNERSLVKGEFVSCTEQRNSNSEQNVASSEDHCKNEFYAEIHSDTQQTHVTVSQKDKNTPNCSKPSVVKTCSSKQNDINTRENMMDIVRSDSTDSQNVGKSRFKENPMDLYDSNENSKNNTNDSLDNVNVGRKNPTTLRTNEKSTQDPLNLVQQNEKETNRTASLSDDAAQNNITSSLDILQKALSSLPDQELRDKALKALAACGISQERHVPLRPPPDTKSVRDAQSQTTVFGVLEGENFVTVKEDTPEILREKEIEMVYNYPFESTVSHNDQQKLLGDENLSLPASSNTIGLFGGYHDSFDPLPYIDEMLISNLGTGAAKVKEVLMKPNKILERAYEQLKKDFEECKEWDEDGLLGIHRAVIDGTVQQVRRKLTVLAARKEDADVLTRDGMTALELAVRYDSDPEIVRVLLNAGASAASGTSTHESALIIASKMSSAVLPDLVSSVQYPTLLDSMDSEGFTALHHCAQRGNLDGVQALVFAKANVNWRDSRSGRTPLFHALEARHLDIVFFLLDHGAVSNTPNFSGHTPLSLVDDFKNQTLLEAMSRAVK